MIRLVALDIDGTVVPHGEPAPSARMTAAIQELSAAGVAVVLASGRMFPGSRAVHRHLELETPLICQQGCGIHLPDGTMTHEFPIERPVAMELVEYARGRDHAYEWFNPLRYLVSRHNVHADEYGRLSGITPEYLERPEESDVDPTGVGVISSHELAREIHRQILGAHGHLLHVLDFPEVTVAVSQSANKGSALELVCQDLGIERDETMAVGDSVNDAPMLAWSPNSFAMPDSDAYAVDAAAHQLDDEPEVLASLLESVLP